MIDFSDPSSYRGINSDDLAIYVKLEQAHLNREIENVLGEGGTFSTHSTDEFARLQEDFNSAYESYVKGMALLSMGWYRTPMVPGGPDPMTFTKVVGSIALSCTLGPWAAFALNAALTGVDVAVGTTAWKHAAVQLGVGAAAAYAPGIGSQLVNIAASGIDYEEGGGIGWDNNNFKQGVVRGVATMVITPALGGAMGEFGKTALGTGLTTGLTTFATNSLTAGDGWSIGWDGGNWQQHLTEGVASGVTAAIMQGARGKQGKDAQGRPITGTDKQPQPNVFGDSFVNKAVSGAINSSIMTMGYHAFGGNGFENNSFSKFNWNSMAYSAQDLGGFLGNKANGWVLNHYGIDKDTGVRMGNRENDSWFDKAVSSLHEGSIKIDNGIKGFFSNVGKMAGDGVRDLAQSTGNLFRYGEFATNDSDVMRRIQEQERVAQMWQNQSGNAGNITWYANEQIAHPNVMANTDPRFANNVEEPKYDEAGNIINRPFVFGPGEHPETVCFRKTPQSVLNNPGRTEGQDFQTGNKNINYTSNLTEDEKLLMEGKTPNNLTKSQLENREPSFIDRIVESVWDWRNEQMNQWRDGTRDMSVLEASNVSERQKTGIQWTGDQETQEAGNKPWYKKAWEALTDNRIVNGIGNAFNAVKQWAVGVYNEWRGFERLHPTTVENIKSVSENIPTIAGDMLKYGRIKNEKSFSYPNDPETGHPIQYPGLEQQSDKYNVKIKFKYKIEF